MNAGHPALRVASPFDAIRQLSADGSEFWSARDLCPLLGYEKWERFSDAIQRAYAAMANVDGEDAARAHFPAAGKLVTGGVADREVRDVHLTRRAAYLVALNGDPRKPEIAAAQAYFVARTREAELAEEARATSALPTQARALLMAVEQIVRLEDDLAAQAQQLAIVGTEAKYAANRVDQLTEKFDHRTPDDPADVPITATTIGARLTPPVSGQRANQLLEAAGLQWRQNHGTWVPTADGRKYAENVPVQHASGRWHDSLQWQPRVIPVLERRLAARSVRIGR